jgi:hypothetical protein
VHGVGCYRAAPTPENTDLWAPVSETITRVTDVIRPGGPVGLSDTYMSTQHTTNSISLSSKQDRRSWGTIGYEARCRIVRA